MGADRLERVLLVEDDALLAMDETRHLEDAGFSVAVVSSGQAAIDSAKNADLVLMDIDLGPDEMDGTEAAGAILKERELPIVFLTCHGDKATVAKARAVANYGYVLKSCGPYVIVETVRRAFELFASQAHDRESAKKLQALAERSSVGIVEVRIDGGFEDANSVFCELVGYTVDELREMTIYDISHPDDLPQERHHINGVVAGRQDEYGDTKRFVHKDGHIVWVCLESATVRDVAGNDLYAVAVVKGIGESAHAANKSAYLADLIEESLNEVYLFRADTFRIVLANGAARRNLGYSQSELARMTPLELAPELSEESLRKLLATSSHQNRSQTVFETKHRRKDGSVYDAEVRLGMMRYCSQDLFVAFVLDTTERNAAKNLTRAIIDSADDIVVFKDTNSVFRVVNAAMARFVGMSEEELVGRTDFDVFPLDEATRFRADDKWVLATKKSIVKDEYATGPNGPIWVNTAKSPVLDAEGNTIGLVVTVRDITDRKRLEDQLHQERDNFKSMADLTGDIILRMDGPDSITFVNEAACRFWGKSKCELLASSLADLVDPADLEPTRRAVEPFFAEKTSIGGFVNTQRTPRGIRTLVWNAVSILDSQGRVLGMQATARDITEQYDRLLVYKNVLDDCGALVYVADLESYEVLFMNSSAKAVYGDREGERCWEVIHSNHRGPCPFCRNAQLVDGGGVPTRGISYESKDPSDGRWYRRYSAAVPWIDNRLVHLEMDFDITELKEQQEQLVALNTEKELLMREINHRVKNNLAIVMSLLSLKSEESGGAVDLSDVRNQVDAIRLVHEKLSTSDNPARIQMQEYIQDLLESEFSSLSSHRVRIVNRIDVVWLPTRIAVTIGLIVTELATNAGKHGFTDGRPAVFTVAMSRDESGTMWRLTVANSGKPFPDELGVEDGSTLGLRLVASLARQIHGTVDLRRRPNPEFTIAFPAAYAAEA